MTATPRLFAHSLTIKDVLGIRKFAVEPGRVTRIEGRNGSMKSSVQQAILATLGGGNLAKITRIGDEGEQIEPEVVIVLDAEGMPANEYHVVKKGDKTARVLARVGDTQAFEDVPQPQAWLNRHFDVRSSSVVQLLKAPDKDLSTLILEALPLEIDRVELASILGIFTKHVRPVPKGLHALEELASVRGDLFNARTGVNHNKDAAKKSAEQLRRALPAVMPGTHDEAIRELRGDRDALQKEITQEEERAVAAEREALSTAQSARDVAGEQVAGGFKTFASKRRGDLATEVGAVETELEKAIAALRQEAATKVADLRATAEAEIAAKKADGEASLDEADEALATAREAARAARATAEAALKGKREQLQGVVGRLATLESERDQAQKAAGLAEQVEKFDAQEKELKEESERMTETLTALDEFRLRLAKSLPVPGLEIVGQEIKVNGVPWAQLNKGQRVGILVKVAVLRAQGMALPLIFVDDAETLDSEHLRLLETELAASGIQALIGRVRDSDLQVVTDGQPTAVAAE
jgi:hypothetical protein